MTQLLQQDLIEKFKLGMEHQFAPAWKANKPNQVTILHSIANRMHDALDAIHSNMTRNKFDILWRSLALELDKFFVHFFFEKYKEQPYQADMVRSELKNFVQHVFGPYSNHALNFFKQTSKKIWWNRITQVLLI